MFAYCTEFTVEENKLFFSFFLFRGIQHIWQPANNRSIFHDNKLTWREIEIRCSNYSEPKKNIFFLPILPLCQFCQALFIFVFRFLLLSLCVCYLWGQNTLSIKWPSLLVKTKNACVNEEKNCRIGSSTDPSLLLQCQ